MRALDPSPETPPPRQRLDLLGREHSEHLLRALIDNTPQCIKLVAPDGTFLYMNAAGLAILGLRAEEVVGRPMLDMVAPEWRDAVRALHQRVCGGEKGHLQFEILLPSGQRRRIETSSVPLRSPADGALLHLALSSDITERHRLEDQLRQSQKMEAVGRLAGGVAHDFNNLLTVIGGNASLLLDEVPESSPLRPFLLDIQHATERAAELTRQLLAFGRKSLLLPQVLDLNELVREAVRLLARLLGADVLVRAELSPDLGRVRADPAQLNQVLLNLAVNARDAMPDGGTLTIRTTDAVLGESGRHVLLEVSDSGCGMSAEVRQQVFEPFFTTKEVGKGTGLGLSTVYGIVTQGGGRVEVDSEPGRGSSFRVYLACVEDPGEGGR
jgi:PAS domain S-box-containing protein